jgi:hypothetical protein
MLLFPNANSPKAEIMFRTVRVPLVAALLFAGGLAIIAPSIASAGSPKQVPFKEHLTLVGFGPLGEAYYVGTATHLGRVQVVEYFNPDFDPSDPESVFATYIKYAANGDTVYGRVIPDDPANPFTTGALTTDGGTGRFQGATGTSLYVVSFDPATGYSIAVEGTISSVGSNK